MPPKRSLPAAETKELLMTLKARFDKNMNRHKGLDWAAVQVRLEADPEKLWSLSEMEATGGEPDVVGQDKKSSELIFMDCAPESPKERRSICYDRAAWEARKEHKPKNTAQDMASEIGVELLSEVEYRDLQMLGPFDQKTSSWLKTPEKIRKLGGAIFGDHRFGTVFVYHNGAESYYSSRGYRGVLRV